MEHSTNLFYFHNFFLKQLENDKYDALAHRIVHKLIIESKYNEDDLFSIIHHDAYTYFGQEKYIEEMKYLITKIVDLYDSIHNEVESDELSSMFGNIKI